MEADEILKFMNGTRVKTPMGNGLVIGYLLRKKDELVVSLDVKPVSAFDKGKNPILVWSFEPKELEIITDEK
ncbi:MAG: hypothetical protein IH586_22305 [Anaerolineaceae bacterium]|nr:hypothetical protein [Anaerolineaceae bacterium]